MKAVLDEHLIVREYYNPNDFDLYFERDNRFIAHIAKNRIPPGFNTMILKPGNFIKVPHGYWVIHTKDKRPYNLITNFGDMIGKGNKLPSRLG